MSEGFAIHELENYAKSVQLFSKLRSRLLNSLKAAYPDLPPNSIIALKGQTDVNIHDTDQDYEFRFESFTFNVTGLKISNFVVLIEVDSGQVHVFVSGFDEILKVFLEPSTPESVESEYGYKAYYRDRLSDVLGTLKPALILLNKGLNTDSKIATPTSYFKPSEFDGFQVDEDKLYPVFVKCRSIKLPEEIEIMTRIIRASSEAHIKVMQNCRSGIFEYSLAGHFRSHISINYGYTYSFTPISASGSRAAVLHYPFMDQEIPEGVMMLCDMGAYAFGYSSDIACSFPVNGKFSESQSAIYNLVLKANRQVIASMRPGSEWTDMHLLAEKIIIEGLVNLGVLKGDVDEIQSKRIGAVFFPHGLGHFLGHDTHDVGGYICGHSRSTEPGIRCLRTRRQLEAGMIITVEPGCYFIDFAIDQALQDENLKIHFGERLQEFRGFGGVRIEDDVLVGEHGGVILTNVPRKVEDIERVMAGGLWNGEDS
jgi:Xaa-Pro dipeptidase